MNGNDEPSLTDITFLRAIRDLNDSPDSAASTEQGVTPATVTAIAESTTLTEAAVTSRLDELRLGKRGLVKVYEAVAPGDDSPSLNSAELTAAGEQAIADASESGESPTGSVNETGTTEATEPADESDRLAALEDRIEQLEADTDASPQPAPGEHEQVAELAEEVSALRKTTDRLASRLDEALEELDAIRSAEYGALDEKRKEQFETAVRSMVAFHQLATKVLDVRVENYEPAAGHADPERVEITRNRIGDALGVGKNGGGDDSVSLDSLGDADSDWPDPEEVAQGDSTFSAGGASGDIQHEPAEEADNSTEAAESDAPDSGVYPPIGGEDSETSDTDETADKQGKADADESDVPDTGVYPPIGDTDTTDEAERADETAEEVDGSLPESVRPDTDAVEGATTESPADSGEIVDPIWHPPDTEIRSDSWRLGGVDTETALAVCEAVAAENGVGNEPVETSTLDDSDSDGDAYARIVAEAPPDPVDRNPSKTAHPDDDD